MNHPLPRTSPPDQSGAGWKAALLRFLDSGHVFTDAERTLSYKHRFINTVFLLASLVVSVFGTWRLVSGDNLVIAVIDLVFAGIAILLLIGLRHSPKSAIDGYATAALTMCFLLFGTVYVAITDTVRSGPFLLIIASAFFLKGPSLGYRWSFACILLMLLVELLPAPYSKGLYGTVTSIIDIVCLILLLILYESRKSSDAEALRANEEKFRTLFNSSNDAIFLVRDGRLEQWNDAALNLLRSNDGALAGMPLAALASSDNPAELLAAVSDAIRLGTTRRSAPLELLLARADGSTFYANLRLTPVTIGGLAMIQAIVRDIDARKRSELELIRYRDDLEILVRERTQRLEESERRFSRLLELTEEGIFIHENGIITDVTNAFCRLTGYVKSELIGRDFIVLLVPPDERERVRNYIAAAGTHSYELGIVCADGSRIEVEAFGRPVDIGGRPLRAGVWRDITVRKETECNLTRARQLAEETTRAKSAFIANMSHEIRTPLNAIIGITRQMRRDSEDPQLHQRLDRVSQAARHLLMVLTDILDISKIEAGKLTLEQRPFSSRQLIDTIDSLLRDTAAQKGLQFRILVDERIPPVMVGDAMRLSQVLLNLASNSLKFTEQGNVTLWISVIGAGPGTVSLRFRVSDTGIGIAPEQQTRLFSDFEQAESSISRRYGGTGLGLSISRRLVELMGGQIQMRSEAGSGSDFWFELTLPISNLPRAGVERADDDTTADEVRERHAGAHILLAEDTPINREIACDLLAEVGMRVDIAENGRLAVERAGTTTYDLILMDLQMPQMDGIAATRAIRALPGGNAVPIVAMTANAYSEDKTECLQAGMNDYLTKPIEAGELFAVLDRWLKPADMRANTMTSFAPAALPQPATPAQMPNDDPDAAQRKLALLTANKGFGALPGVTLAQHKPHRYLALLGQFFAEHGDDGARLRQLVHERSAQAQEDAARIAHTLKGLAATFGMSTLLDLTTTAQRVLGEESIDIGLAGGLVADIERELQALAQLVEAIDDRNSSPTRPEHTQSVRSDPS